MRPIRRRQSGTPNTGGMQTGGRTPPHARAMHAGVSRPRASASHGPLQGAHAANARHPAHSEAAGGTALTAAPIYRPLPPQSGQRRLGGLLPGQGCLPLLTSAARRAFQFRKHLPFNSSRNMGHCAKSEHGGGCRVSRQSSPGVQVQPLNRGAHDARGGDTVPPGRGRLLDA